MSLMSPCKTLALAALLLSLSTAGAKAEVPAAGSVLLLSGQGTAADTGGEIRALAKGTPVYSGDVLNTAANSFLNLKFTDGGYVLMRPDSRFQVRDFVDASVVAAKPAAASTDAKPAVAAACKGVPKLQIDGCAAGQTLPLGTLSFKSGSQQLSASAQKVLKSLASALQQQPEVTLEIDAVVDSGTKPASARFYQRRADAVKQYLVARGVAAQRLTVQSLSRPPAAADKSAKPGRGSKPRIELKVVTATPTRSNVATGNSKAGMSASSAVNIIGQTRFTARPTQAADTAPLVPAPQAAAGSHAFFSLLKGGFRAVSGAIGKINHDDYDVTTPVATIGIRGTDYLAVLCDANCAHDPIIDPLLDPSVDATGGVVFGDVAGSIVLTSAQGQYILLPGQYVLVLPDGRFVPLPSSPRFLRISPLPDPQNCSVPG